MTHDPLVPLSLPRGNSIWEWEIDAWVEHLMNESLIEIALFGTRAWAVCR